MSQKNDMERTSSGRINRRSWLKGIGLAPFVGLAGCSQNGGDGGGGDGGDGGSDGGGSDGGDGAGGDVVIGETHERLEEVVIVVGRPRSARPQYFEAGRVIVDGFEQVLGEGVVTFRDLAHPEPSNTIRYQSRDYDCCYVTNSAQTYRLDPSFYLYTCLHSSTADEQGTFNFGGYKNDEFDRLAEEQVSEFEDDRRQELVYEQQRIAYEEDLAWSMFVHEDYIAGINTDYLNPPDEVVPSANLLAGFLPVANTEATSQNEENIIKYAQFVSNIDRLNPVAVTRAPVQMFLQLTYDTLTKLDSTNRSVNWLAESRDVIDNTTIAFTIKDGVEWHDGEGEVTPEDVAFSYNYHMEHKTPYVIQNLDPLDQASVEGDRVIFEFSEPSASFTTVATTNTLIIPQHIWEDIDNPQEVRNDPPIGSNVFKLTRWEEAQVMEYEKHDAHFHDLPVDGLRAIFYGSLESAVEGVLAGDAHMIDRVEGTHVDQIDQAPNVELQQIRTNSTNALTWNERRGMPFTDQAFKWAMDYAIPRQDILDVAFNGRGVLGASMIAPTNEFWHNPDIDPNPFDVEQARSILSDAGYAWDDDGVLLYPI